MQKSKAVKAILLVIVCVSFGMGVPRLLNISTSDSMKDHVFVLRPFNKDVGNGTIVRYPHQDAVTEGKTLYMLKRVACASGQHLTADSIKKEYYCDGKYLARAKSVSAKGIPVQNFVYDGIIPEGKFFAMAPHIDSYDSRYYGLVDAKIVVGTFYPVF